MKWYTKVLAVMVFLLVCVCSVVSTCAVLVTDFIPIAVCAGEETFAVAERLKNRWCVSVLKQNGELQCDVSFSADTSCNETALSYADGMYYFWTKEQTDSEKNTLTVHQISPEKHMVNTNTAHLQTEAGEQLCGMRIHETTLSVIGWHNEENQTVLSVYLAGKDSPMFSLSQTYTMPQIYFIRNAFYQSDGSIVFLTASGRVYSVSPPERKPTLLFDGKKIPASDFCLDAEEKICLLDCDGTAIRLTDSNTAESCLTSMCSQLSHTASGMTLSDCTDISLLSDNYAAVLFPNEDGDLCAGLYQNGMLNLLDSISHHAWWEFVLLFLGLMILMGVAVCLLIFGTWFLFRESVTMQYRVSVFCIAVAVIVLAIVTVNTYHIYTQQKEEQNWERLTIMLNNAEVYLNPEESDSLDWLAELDWDYDMQNAVENDFVQRLWAFSNADTSGNSNCLLFVLSENGGLTAVSGTSEQICRHPEQIYDKETAEQLSQLTIQNTEQLSGTFQKDGISWMYLAQPVFSIKQEKTGILVMQMPSENQLELRIFVTNLLLYLAVIGFVLLLLLRIRYVLRPLQKMEVQAQKFIVSGNCDPIPIKGNNEITVLTRRFIQVVSDLKKSMEQSRRSAESYGRFVDQNWITLMEKENLSALHMGDCVKHQLAVLEMRLTPKSMLSQEDKHIQKYQMLYAGILPVIQKNNGISESISPDHMRFLFPRGCFDAVCAASVVREIVQEQFTLEAVIDYGLSEVSVCGDDDHMRICSEMQEETARMPLLHQICREFGCQILVTGESVQAIPDFQTIFNCRTVGFFRTLQNNEETIHMIEILPQRCSDVFERAVRLYQSGSYEEAFGMFFAVLEKNPDDHAATRYLHLCHQALQKTGK